MSLLFFLLILRPVFDEEVGVIVIAVLGELNVQYQARHKKIVLRKYFISAFLVWCVISTVP